MTAPPRPAAAVTGEDESRLCLSCGMCCSGTLHAAIALDHDEPERAERAGFALVPDPDDGSVGAAQPCPQLEGTACRLYGGWRPRACGAYACKVLTGLRGGELSTDEAVALIAAIKARIAQLLPDMGERPLRALVGEAAELTRSKAITPENAAWIMAVGAVNREIDQKIRRPGQSSFR